MKAEEFIMAAALEGCRTILNSSAPRLAEIIGKDVRAVRVGILSHLLEEEIMALQPRSLRLAIAESSIAMLSHAITAPEPEAAKS